MDFHAITGDGSELVLTTHRGPVDETPLQMISAHQLAYYQRVEAAYLGLLQRQAEPVAGVPAPAGPDM